MTDKDKTTNASKVELTDDLLDNAEGGAVSTFMKIEDIPGESARARSAGAGKATLKDIPMVKYVD